MSRSLIGIAVAAILAGNLATAVARADDAELTEIVVTAQRRSQNVQDVPAAIQVFTPQQLAEFRIEQTGDLAAYTPGLGFQLFDLERVEVLKGPQGDWATGRREDDRREVGMVGVGT
jgi:outer membrane receptor protein involved in Fe transport